MRLIWHLEGPRQPELPCKDTFDSTGPQCIDSSLDKTKYIDDENFHH